ncbi:contact-dependent growth inhibition system immunity protein [Streptomyces cucumeris]|uniref:contact-dependent growth inhibition system immunity protein n=1 Tax=Streptomyces cucumeris TaxID=2962890 RepID=UPI003D74EDB6
MSRLLHRDRTLEELDGVRWPDAPDNATGLVRTVYALRHRKLGALTAEDLRTLIAQNVGLPFLLPLALEVLRDEPLAEARYYEGDLLSVVLRCDPGVWAVLPDLAGELVAIVSGLPEVEDHLAGDAQHFLATRGAAATPEEAAAHPRP